MATIDSTAQSIELVRKYLAVVEACKDTDALRRLLHPEAQQEEFPNALYPRGQKRDAASLITSFERGRDLLAEQRYEIVNILASGDTVALEMVWTGSLRIDAGPLKAGQVLRARIATVIELRDGLIFRQRNYDCYDPLSPS